MQQFHHDPRPGTLGDHVVDLHDTRVRQRRRGPGLAQGALVHRGAVLGRHAGREEDLLHRDVSAQQAVGRLPDGTHAAVADRRAQLVPAADHRAGDGTFGRGGRVGFAVPRRGRGSHWLLTVARGTIAPYLAGCDPWGKAEGHISGYVLPGVTLRSTPSPTCARDLTSLADA